MGSIWFHHCTHSQKARLIFKGRVYDFFSGKLSIALFTVSVMIYVDGNHSGLTAGTSKASALSNETMVFSCLVYKNIMKQNFWLLWFQWCLC